MKRQGNRQKLNKKEREQDRTERLQPENVFAYSPDADYNTEAVMEHSR